MAENKCFMPGMDKERTAKVMAECCEGKDGVTDCCESMSETDKCNSMMAECMKKCRWFPLVLVIFGVVFLLLGYYLDAEVTRTLWMILSALIIIVGTAGLVMMKICCKTTGGSKGEGIRGRQENAK